MIEVYAVELPEKMNPELFNLLLNSASPVKRQRIERFVRETDKLSGLFSDLLIRSIIMGKTGLKNSQISFGQNEYGKPYLIGVDDFHFNISHAGVWVVAAVDSAPVGIDVEKMLDVEIGLSNHYFTEDEHSDLMSHHDRKSYFFTLWSLKESYVKNLGKGLSCPLNSFSIRFVTRDQIVVTAEGKPRENIKFTEYHIHRDYKMFLCATHNRFPSQVNMLPVEQLVEEFVAL